MVEFLLSVVLISCGVTLLVALDCYCRARTVDLILKVVALHEKEISRLQAELNKMSGVKCSK